MINLFLDSNIWLLLYSFSKDDISQFSKLKDLLAKDVKIYIPEQVKNEIFRRRDSVIKQVSLLRM